MNKAILECNGIAAGYVKGLNILQGIDLVVNEGEIVSIIGPNRAGIFLSLIPLFSTFLAMILFDEKFLFFHLIGSILIILGLFLSNKKISNA